MPEELDVRAWWRGGKPSPDVAERLDHIALGRAQVFLPILIVAMVGGILISEPSGIPLTGLILVVNGVVIATAIGIYIALRLGRIPPRQAHAVGALVWLFAPINTLTSVLLIDSPTLTLPLMIELASLPILIDTRWATAASMPVVAAAIPLMMRGGTIGVFISAVVGVWVVGLLMQLILRRAMIRSETHRLNLQTALEALKFELAERQRAEADREALRDQFVHAQRMDAVGTLSAGLAHDMNNILGGILAFAEILRAEATDKQVQEDLDKIRQEAERGAALTRGLLAFSRRGAYRRRPIALGGVLDDITALISRTLGKNIKVERKDGPIAIIDGDPAQLGQVLINLCLNGADAMDGTGTITITTDVIELDDDHISTLPGGQYVRLSVSDTGCGMDAATRKRMFEPFFTTKPVGKGTGLGLAMVYGAVEAHGGAIQVESTPGTGTTIHIYIPTTDELPVLAQRADSQPALRQGLVLIVDDEATMRAGASRIIERLGFRTTGASDGDEALELFVKHEGEVSFVLLDMAMPRMSGSHCFRELRKVSQVPIILMSGYTDHTAAQDLLADGASGFLEKPYTADQLGQEIDRLLGRRAGSASS